MNVKSLKYTDFRNLEDGEFRPSDGVNIIYGENAQGKTNLIEALWILSGSKSFRCAKDRKLVKIGAEKATLEMDFYAAGREQNAVVEIDEKRRGTVNGVPLQSMAHMAESFSAVMFAPTDLELVKSGPQLRRMFLNMAISSLRPKYYKVLCSYNRAVMQRNILLRDTVAHAELEDMLDAYEEKAAMYGEYVINQRRRYVEALNEYAPQIYRGISSGEQLGVEYSGASAFSEAGALLRQLRESRREDRKNGATSVGPHRDDLELSINGMNAREYGSQGQQRSAVLALKLAQAQILKRYTGELPVAILDDVMSELDVKRQDFLLNHTDGWQVFITCCDPAQIEKLKSGKKFEMKKGRLNP